MTRRCFSTGTSTGTRRAKAAVAQAKAAAGDRNILPHGADTAQRCLRARLLDEMEIQLVPVLPGEGRRLFDRLGAEHIELELTRTIDAPGVQHLRYRIVKTTKRADTPGDCSPRLRGVEDA